MRKFLLSVVTTMLAATSVLAGAGSASAAVSCSYNSCLDKDPAATNCDADAATTWNVVTTPDETLQLRSSIACHSYWARLRVSGVNMDTNGCGIAHRRGDLRARISTRKLVNGTWKSLETAASTWKDCGDPWDGDTSTAWTTMVGASVSSTIQIRVCEEYLKPSVHLGTCSVWIYI